MRACLGLSLPFVAGSATTWPGNAAPVGVPTISGTATEGQTLTADASGVTDADGLGTFAYQWLRDGTPIGGATGTTYVLVDADVGATIRVLVSYTDGMGKPESVLSAATAAVSAANHLLLTEDGFFLLLESGDKLLLEA